jgi:hypothetical protein
MSIGIIGMMCLPHRVSLVLEVEGLPVNWASITVPRRSGSCPLCRAHQKGPVALQAAVKQWLFKARSHPEILTDGTKDSSKDTDKDKSMDYKEQQSNKQKLREENNKRVARSYNLTGASNHKSDASSRPPKSKPNHLRIVKD